MYSLLPSAPPQRPASAEAEDRYYKAYAPGSLRLPYIVPLAIVWLVALIADLWPH